MTGMVDLLAGIRTYALTRRLIRVLQLSQLLKMEAGGVHLFQAEEPKVVAHENLRGMSQYAGGEA